ncbi:MAG: hypothetical protein ACFFD2_11215 [Promethearchaeota archaeon]
MAKKRWYLPLLLIPLVIGLIHGFAIANSINVFLSWLLIGAWLCVTFYFFRKLRSYHEFGSSYNTSTFILSPLFIGIFYCLWGYYTGLLDWNLFGSVQLYFSFWILIFAFPYLVRGAYGLYSCYRRYDVVYIGQKSISARKFGIFATCLTFIVEIFVIFFFIAFQDVDLVFESIHIYPDFMLLIMSLFSIYLLIRHGIFGTQPSLPEISAVTASQRPIIEETIPSPSRSISPRTRSRNTSSRSRSRTTSASSPRNQNRSYTTTNIRNGSRTSAKSRGINVSGTRVKEEKRSKIVHLAKKLKPKAGKLSLDDFKCIFCFQLPKFPEDKGRGIVLCPKCKHPAHADEFQEWLQSSNLCSRCDAPMPARFRRNPEVYSVKTYVNIIKLYSKKIKN